MDDQRIPISIGSYWCHRDDPRYKALVTHVNNVWLHYDIYKVCHHRYYGYHDKLYIVGNSTTPSTFKNYYIECITDEV